MSAAIALAIAFGCHLVNVHLKASADSYLCAPAWQHQQPCRAEILSAFSQPRFPAPHCPQNFVGRDDGNVTFEALIQKDVLAVLCCPLVQDPVGGIQCTALTSLAKLVDTDPLVGETIMGSGVLGAIVLGLSHNSPQVQVAANTAVQSLARISVANATHLIDAGALTAVLKQLDVGSDAAKEASLWTLKTFAAADYGIAEGIAQPDTLRLMVSLMKAHGAVPGVQKAALGALKHIAVHDWKLARAVVAAGPLPTAVAFTKDERHVPCDVRAAAFRFLSQVARHDDELAGQVADAGAPAVRFFTAPLA